MPDPFADKYCGSVFAAKLLKAYNFSGIQMGRLDLSILDAASRRGRQNAASRFD